MKLNELDEFNLNDAVTFRDELNPALFTGSSLKPEVRSQLLTIAEDFLEHLGIADLDVEDITISGSNAGYSYTTHSDIDLHVIVDMSKLRDDIVYRELFDAKKNLYNTTHDIEINGYEVELYVQDSNDPVISLGEYSVSKNKWIHLPRKRRAHFDQVATAAKFNKLMSIAEIANKSKNLDLVKKVIDTIKRYRQAGLDAHGEFGPENLAYKAIRSRGLINHLRRLVQVLHSEKLSLPESKMLNKPEMTVDQLAKKHNMSRMHIAQQLDIGIKVELEHTTHRTVAREIALNHLAEDPNYYTKLKGANLEESRFRYSPYFNGTALTEGQQYLNSINGTVPINVWLTALSDIIGGANGMLAESISSTVLRQVQELEKFSAKNPAVGSYYIPVPIMIIGNTVHVMDISGNSELSTNPELLQLVSKAPHEYDFRHNDRILKYPYGKQHKSVYTTVILLNDVRMYDKIRTMVELYFEKTLPPVITNETSGYIPSEKEKNDPRYKTALTVDVHPDSIKKNAKAFGFNTSRAGIPPTISTTGKF